MKSLEELYREVQSDDEMKKEFVTSFKEGRVESFLQAHGCDAAAADVMAFLNGTQKEALSDDDMEKVAGGSCSSFACKWTKDPYYCF